MTQNVDVKKAATTKESLAYVVSELLGLPIGPRKGTSYKIVTTIVKTMTDALLRGESVKIRGFGIFSIRERPPTRRGFYYYIHIKGPKRPGAVINVPAKRYVIFKPSKVLLRLINQPNQENQS